MHSFRETFLGMADQYDLMADSITMRVQSVLQNVTDKRSKCEKKIFRLKEMTAAA